MQRFREVRLAWFVAAVLALSSLGTSSSTSASRPQDATSLEVEAGHQGCSVELDSAKAGETSVQGELLLGEIDPGDHYVHLDCPGEAEQVFFISPKPGERLSLRPEVAGNPPSPLEAAESRLELQKLVQNAIQLRAAGQFAEAIDHLHHAILLDTQNSDLHRDLGITFLMMKDWKRARVEYLEATRLDPGEADAHNGLGYALEKLGEIERARDEFRMAMRLDPGDPTYRQHYFEAEAGLAAEKAKKK
jgi:tetratricopeptide (TPR) repeat protein